ncbi:MAG: tetratricopeptide repeat protein [Sandaracinaceae bacterium]
MRRPASALALVLASLIAAPTARADSLAEVFARANAAYFRGDFDEAVRLYESLEELGVRDADVEYDLATAYARTGRYGEAIRHYERAILLRPGDDGATAGLEAARSALGRRRAARQGEAEVDSGPPLSEALFGSISRDALAIATQLASLAFFATLIGLLFVKRESVRLGLGIAAPLTGILLFVCGLGWTLRAGWFDEGEAAVVLVDRASLLDAPSGAGSELGRGVEGERAWILHREREWTLVRTRDAEGWAHTSEIGPIAFDAD